VARSPEFGAIPLRQGTRPSTVLVSVNRGPSAVERPTAVDRVIRTRQPRRLRGRAVGVAQSAVVLVRERPAVAAARTVVHGDDRANQLRVDRQLLVPAKTRAELLEVALLHEGHQLIDPAARLVLVGAAVGFADPEPPPAAAGQTAIRVVV